MKTMIFVVMFLLSAISFAFDDQTCNLVRVIDGDTIVCNIDKWPDIIGNQISVRMRGCDSPEVRTSDLIEKNLGIYAKELLIQRLYGINKLTLRNIEQGKYFRLIADIYADEDKLTCFENKLAYAQPVYSCKAKSRCSEMTSCNESFYYYNSCGHRNLDKDGDGIPCESLCY